jgi:hypothetical protein
MFDLDDAISEWQRQLTADGINSTEVLDELESHLRDDIAQQMQGGASEAHSFENAIQRLGHAGLLKTEFAKVGGWQEFQARLHEAILTLAGIPTLATNMNTTHQHTEPWWVTYLKAGAFLLPAVLLWTLSVIFIVPKLQQICRDAGGVPLPTMLQGMFSASEYAMWIVLGIIASIGALEWRSTAWPRYRRAVVGVGAFTLNSIVLIAIFMMVVLALLAAPGLMGLAK